MTPPAHARHSELRQTWESQPLSTTCTETVQADGRRAMAYLRVGEQQPRDSVLHQGGIPRDVPGQHGNLQIHRLGRQGETQGRSSQELGSKMSRVEGGGPLAACTPQSCPPA